jgi:cyclohexyl-isocyanide hydratase
VTENATPLQFGLLIFPKVQQLDLTGPYEVFATWPGGRVRLVAKTLDPVTSATGLVLKPDTSFDECPRLDVLCIPGGAGVNALMADETTLAFMKRQAEGARFVTSVCTGALVLGAAGLLGASARLPIGRRTTCSRALARSRSMRGSCATAT